MITIEQHISDLLYTYECVIIPDFGAFVATTISARINQDKNILLPPGKEIGFNRSLSHNDGLLISTYAQIKGVSYGIAKSEIEKFRHHIIEKLESGQSVELPKIGVLKSDSIGNVQFTSDRSENYLVDSFGLSSFHFTPDIQLKPVNENEQVKRLLKPFNQKHIAATVALMIGLFAISPRISDEAVNTDYNTASTVDFFVPVNNIEPALKVDPETFSGDETKEVEEIAEVENHFFVIAGSFKKESQAQQFLKRIHRMGEDQAYILVSSNNRYRIALNGYSDKDEAVNVMTQYRKLKDFKTVWVLKQ